ncbi:MAG: hypothetical protein QOJ72_638, partial [Nocardioidaceae bacterium]|nr:hypothetical protein [Nocardioidaceae bacterium]
MTLRHHLRSRLAEEGGFTLAVAMGIMMIASIISIAAFEASRGDILPSKQDHDRRVAYTAAESGISWYQNKLAGDPDLWRKCDSNSSSTNPINQPNVTAAQRTWKSVSGSGTCIADFSICLLPITSTCSSSDRYSMLSSSEGTFRI